MHLDLFVVPHATRVATAFFQHEGARRLHQDVRAPGDTMTVFHPPPDITPLERVIRWFFSVPQWVQVGGIVLAAVLGLVAVVVLWKNRAALAGWIRTRHIETPQRWKIAGGVAAATVLLALGVAGFSFFTYTQHANQFCISCHTLHDEVWMRFQQSKHHRTANLECHDCHRESMFASVMQVVKWIALRPEEVGPHAPVPTGICAECHIRKDPDKKWQRIVATAGHSVHILTDTAKKLDIQCVTCHGVSAHRFVPVSTTCGQSGCHEKTRIQLGKMAQQTDFHCVQCHQFTAAINETARLDSARLGLMPTFRTCLSCHAMRQQMAEFIPARDPHKGQCGACHDPHKQKTPEAAFGTCTNSGCHQRPDTVSAFHRGIAHGTLQDCGQCHTPHTWAVKGDACLRCHADIYEDRPKARRATEPRASSGG